MSEPVAVAKHKTKAKKRYLKGKKERRKQRRALANANKVKSNKQKANTEDEPIEETEDEIPINQASVLVSTPQDEDTEMQNSSRPVKGTGDERIKENRPKKRRKREQILEEVKESTTESLSIGDREERLPGDIKQPIHLESHPPVVIPTFSSPSQPPQASKTQLALQGMDSAMLEAEIVDPATTDRLGEESSVATLLSSRMMKRLGELGIVELFAVQAALIPLLLPKEQEQRSLYPSYKPPRDICASAPTGSGKTLAYVIPIVEILATRIVTRLRALIILPTRDLVQQVKETFDACCKGTNLKIASVSGQNSFSHEQNQLVGNSADRQHGGSSRVDILICTPGRLIDHINGTPNFTLQHLRFLVVDEADRLLTQSFQEWLKRVLRSICPPSWGQGIAPYADAEQCLHQADITFPFPLPDAVAPAWRSPFINGIRADIEETPQPSCQKLLFSATLTRDPAKIASLELRDPKYIIVRGKQRKGTPDGVAMEVDERDYIESFETPATLKEWMIVCEPTNKPLLLFFLAHVRGVTNALVFTKSAESTLRLLRLLTFFEEALALDVPHDGEVITAEAFSSDLAATQRKNVLERFKSKQINILICSDLISRGMDIPHVSHVVNYDVPIDIRKYVHRVGRTARAGREGDAWSLVEEQEAHHFKSLMKQSSHWSKIKKLKIDKAEFRKMEGYYRDALNKLRNHYSQS